MSKNPLEMPPSWVGSYIVNPKTYRPPNIPMSIFFSQSLFNNHTKNRNESGENDDEE